MIERWVPCSRRVGYGFRPRACFENDVTKLVDAPFRKVPSQETAIPAKLRNTQMVCCGHSPTATKEALT